jgi:hypothetical protein
MLPEPGFSRQIGGGHPSSHPAAQHRAQLAALGGRNPAIQYFDSAVQRQAERPQQQVERLVVRADGDLTQCQVRLLISPHGEVEPVAQRFSSGGKTRIRHRSRF